ncbi:MULTISPECIES: rhodanese-related sulfurtransferase [unclassified Microbacterium]|uniref:oxygen-dependent tRNA uridine(34) hydroxylase TrhO n=1 Tax=unclassified Microbacterium TaxID=2609290 RepID=UPI0021A67907|nr:MULTISPECIES: rhodanese-related sulfurtransferase [unclassified Microbacterium]MCT1363032.1 rhodanese-related sulfurtransferase [Microbacterium sp. p3-SID131]MCT1376960.1 rhodanese-related sulfurtransferase [Microbacterium sp. p3-SID337]
MATPKILLFYAFTPLADPEAIRVWQRDLGEALGLRGRLLISSQGINGTLGGDLPVLKKWVRSFRSYAPFRDADIKWSEGTGLDASGRSLDFPKLSVKVRDEIVSFGAPDELRVDADGVVGGGARLTPEQLHALVAERGDEVVFFDGRNALEAEIGRFRGAVVPDTETTRDFVRLLDSGTYDDLKGKLVVTYCTGGIRCEVLSSLMVARGFGEVYQLEGGIVRYGETFGDDGLWDGSLYVFDGRGSVDFSDHARVIGVCVGCGAATKRTANCPDPSCRVQSVVCADCEAVACPAHAATVPTRA